MKNYLFTFLFLIIASSCNQISNMSMQIQHDDEFNEVISNTNRIVIRAKKPNQTQGANEEKCFENNYLETKDLQQVKFIDSLLDQTPKTEYCCCPNTNYSIAFYNDTMKISTFYADTLEFKNKVRIFEASYQFSFIIEKAIWKSFLKELNRKN
jgi:hypothetical protein